MTRAEILRQAADAVACEWVAVGQRFSPEMPDSSALWIAATNVLCRFYDQNLDQRERHEVIFSLAPTAWAKMRTEYGSTAEQPSQTTGDMVPA